MYNQKKELKPLNSQNKLIRIHRMEKQETSKNTEIKLHSPANVKKDVFKMIPIP